MEERGPGDVRDWRPDLLPRVAHVHAESVDSVATDVISETIKVLLIERLIIYYSHDCIPHLYTLEMSTSPLWL